MCGIAGIIQYKGKADSPALKGVEAMLDMQNHRGPDHRAAQRVDENCTLGHNRLSIIDLSAEGHQPMSSSDGRYHVVYNGEVYNFRELRGELEQKGHRFRSGTDTEVLPSAYAQWGRDMLNRLEGMFAFAIYDRHEQTLLLARDRFGQKPLYYYHDDERMVFASELNALLACPGIDRSPDPHALDLFLSLQYIPAPYTAYRHIRALGPSHAMLVEQGKIKSWRYYDIPIREEFAELPYEEARLQVRGRLTEAVRKRMVADVPLGAFLSGGIDSSIITAILAQHSTQAITTVSVGFNEREYSELDKAKSMAQRYQTDHHEYILDINQAGQDIEKIIASYGQPFGDSSAIPTYYLSQLTRKHVTVALSGDGGDELFSGYQRYRLDRKFNRLQSALTPQLLRPILGMLGLVPPKRNVPIEKNWPLGLKRLAQVNRIDRRASILRWGSYFNFGQKQLLYRDYQATADHAVEYLCRLYDSRPDINGPMQRTQYSDLYSYAPGDYLVKTDIASMQHSLEVRSPLLDHALASLAFSLPAGYSHGPGGKRILKDAFAADLTPEVMHGPKRGFSIPAAEWFQGRWRDQLHDYISSPGSFCKAQFDTGYIAKMMEQHRRGLDDHSKRLYLLLVLEIWSSKQV